MVSDPGTPTSPTQRVRLILDNGGLDTAKVASIVAAKNDIVERAVQKLNGMRIPQIHWELNTEVEMSGSFVSKEDLHDENPQTFPIGPDFSIGDILDESDFLIVVPSQDFESEPAAATPQRSSSSKRSQSEMVTPVSPDRSGTPLAAVSPKRHKAIQPPPSSSCDSRSKTRRNVQRLSCEDIPLQHYETGVEGCIVIQHDMNRQIYFCYDNDTPKRIAEFVHVDVRDLLYHNEQRFPGLTESMKFWRYTPILVPIDNAALQSVHRRKFYSKDGYSYQEKQENRLKGIKMQREKRRREQGIYVIDEPPIDTSNLPVQTPSSGLGGVILIESSKDRRIYYTFNDDTPEHIATLVDVELDRIIMQNKARFGNQLTESTKLAPFTPIVLPLESNLDL